MAYSIVTTFVWTIKNFDMCPHLRNESLHSPNFRIGSYVFSLHLYPRGVEYQNYISAGLKRLNDNGEEKVLVSWKMSVMERDGIISKYHYTSKKVFEKDGTWGEGRFIPRQQLLRDERGKLLPSNNLTIKCDVLALSGAISGDDSNILNDNEDAEILSSDFAQILNSGIYSDLVLYVDENIFSVHKAILQCRCPKLMPALMRSLTGDDNYILHGVKASAFRTILQYLYTGTSNTSDIDEETLITAEKFDIPDLRRLLVFSPFKTVCATTEIVSSRLSLTWVIEDFSKFQQDKEFVYDAFCVNADELCRIQIILTIVNRQNGVGIELKFKTPDKSKVSFLRCKVTAAGKTFGYKTVVTEEYEHIFEDKDWVTPFGPQVEVSRVLIQDRLRMFFVLSMSTREGTLSNIETVTVEAKTEKSSNEVIKNLNKLQRYLRQMYDDIDESTSADITLRVGDKKYRAHKVILCERSPVFAMMFANDSLENKEGVVTIDDIDGETISSMLRYIYCGCINDIGIPEAINLYAAADKYELLTLRDKCATFLKSSMDADHVVDILLLSDAHHDESLKKYVCNYIKLNFGKVMGSKEGLSVVEFCNTWMASKD